MEQEQCGSITAEQVMLRRLNLNTEEEVRVCARVNESETERMR